MSSYRKPLPPYTRLHCLFDYDPATGALTRAETGEPAALPTPQGYLRVYLDRENYAAHRIAWKMATGQDPRRDIDHINGVRSDNHKENLRETDHAGNMRNRAAFGEWPKGVARDRVNNRFRADIGHGPTHEFLGWFTTPEAASDAYNRAAQKRYGDFACLDRRNLRKIAA